MPVKLKNTSAGIPLEKRLDAFRQTIPAGEGWTMPELAKKFKRAESTVQILIMRRKWGVKILSENNRAQTVLVNPKDLARRKPK